MVSSLANGVIAVAVAAETVVWVGSTESLHLLDPVATSVLSEVLRHGIDGAVSSLASQYAAPVDQVHRDVLAVVDQLEQAAVLVWAGP